MNALRCSIRAKLITKGTSVFCIRARWTSVSYVRQVTLSICSMKMITTRNSRTMKTHSCKNFTKPEDKNLNKLVILRRLNPKIYLMNIWTALPKTKCLIKIWNWWSRRPPQLRSVTQILQKPPRSNYKNRQILRLIMTIIIDKSNKKYFLSIL